MSDWLIAFRSEITADRSEPHVREERQESLQRWAQLSFEEQGELARSVRLPRRTLSTALMEDCQFVGLPGSALIGICRQLRLAGDRIAAIHDTRDDLLSVLKAGQREAFEKACVGYGWNEAESLAVLRDGVSIIRSNREHIAAGGERNHSSFLATRHWLEIFRELS